MTKELRRIAYLTGEYPRASDTFIQREISQLRLAGLQVLTASVRQTGAEHHVGPEQIAEAANTFYVLQAARNPLRVIVAHGTAILRAPRRYVQALLLALRTAPPGPKALVYQLFYFAEAGILARYLCENRIQHLHNHIAKSSCSVAMLASEISGIPFSFTLHGPDIFFAPEHWRLDEKIARARFVACISHFCRSQAMAFSDPVHWPRLHIVHCGVLPDRYDGTAEGDGRSLIFVGRLAAVKGLPVLFDALERLGQKWPGLRLTLIGDGPDRAALETRARQSGVRAVFAGYQSQDSVAIALRDSDILVLPSFAEGVPVVLMEAMAAGLPVVASRVAGIPELVDNGISGRLVAPGDSAELAQAIEELLADPALRRKLGAAGRQTVKQEFDVSIEARRLKTLLIHSHEGGAIPCTRPEPDAAG